MQKIPQPATHLALASLFLALSACGFNADSASGGDGAKALAADATAKSSKGDGDSSYAVTAADTATNQDATGAGEPTWTHVAGQGAGGGANGQQGNGLQRVAIIDPNGFEKPMPALWVQVPAGWQSEGGVLWNQQAPCGATPSYQWRARSPDGRQSLQLFPAEAWTYDNLNMNLPGGSCPRWPITDVRSYLQSFVQRNRPGARLLDYRQRNDLIRNAPPPSDGQSRFWKEGGEVLIAYNGPNGEVRESVMAVVQFMETTMAGVMPGEVRRFISGFAGAPVVGSAPNGQLDLVMVTNFAMSATPDPEWQARMDKHNTQIARQGVRGQIERGAIISNTITEVGKINDAGIASSNASSDAIHQANVDSINNVERYTDPVTGNEVQLDNRYDHAWRANDGTYFQSNDPNLNPQVDLGVEAEQIERNE